MCAAVVVNTVEQIQILRARVESVGSADRKLSVRARHMSQTSREGLMLAAVREFSSRIVPDVAVWTSIGRLAMTNNKITLEVILCGAIAKRSGCRSASMDRT